MVSEYAEEIRRQQNEESLKADDYSPPIKTTVNLEPKLTFHVQLAHGSPTGIISGFNNLAQLYQVPFFIHAYKAVKEAFLSSLKVNQNAFASKCPAPCHI